MCEPLNEILAITKIKQQNGGAVFASVRFLFRCKFFPSCFAPHRKLAQSFLKTAETICGTIGARGQIIQVISHLFVAKLMRK